MCFAKQCMNMIDYHVPFMRPTLLCNSNLVCLLCLRWHFIFPRDSFLSTVAIRKLDDEARLPEWE